MPPSIGLIVDGRLKEVKTSLGLKIQIYFLTLVLPYRFCNIACQYIIISLAIYYKFIQNSFCVDDYILD